MFQNSYNPDLLLFYFTGEKNLDIKYARLTFVDLKNKQSDILSAKGCY